MFNSQAPSADDLPSSAQLVKSTIISAVAAAAILVTIVLPSEYGIDPTGVGSAMGLKDMGEIKVQLAEEAEMDRKAAEDAAQPAAASGGTQDQPATTPMEGTSLMDRIIREFGISSAYAQDAALRKDEMSITLQPGEGAEVKLVMVKGATANFTWTANGSKVNFDLHGDGGGESISYEKGRGAAEHSGVLEAAFDGNHGWFWRNRTSDPVTVTLKTDGAYTDIKRIM
ncbi:transmembrane anchor protein [Rhizobium daejeonense]|uniref:Transmembrane anchor protein n=1 Tax=Rhizobium daejeonense TaxID=240521 RepID=A0A6M1RXK3_9HYPH|nr:transmembrane anchor protein [Rhizobium daejeonense]NGO66554.1 transmembrane anchor protein [Rhizobium daejeonense]HCL67723.1 transmembrane anchor protein [Rhizobium sp.]